MADPGPPTAAVIETPLEAQVRRTAEAAEHLAQAVGLNPPPAGGTPLVVTVTTVESIVRSCHETSVIKSLGDDNYTALEAGWVGDSSIYRPDDSRHNDRGTTPLQILRESNEP